MSSLRDSKLCSQLLERLQKSLDGRPFCFMEVCGTHTVAIFRDGLRSLLPPNVRHISGPGCPVCVTHEREIATILELAAKPQVIVATFGDVMRVPGPNGQTLQHAKAAGAQVRVVYSPLDVLALAKANPDHMVVFLGIGFETTAPTVAAMVLAAEKEQLHNVTVYACHKLVPPALKALLNDPQNAVDGFLLPGHVSTILGVEPYTFIAEKYNKPAVIGGFEPADILNALCLMAEQHRTGNICVENAYPRAVHAQGNPKAREVLWQVFRTVDAHWRGLGCIGDSGLAFAPRYAAFDALTRLDCAESTASTVTGCRCGAVLCGKITPDQCQLFGKACTPQQPVGPCMVSTEGSCAAYYMYAL